MKSVKRLIAIALVVASVLCIQMSIIGVSSEIKSELKRVDDLDSEIMDIFDLPGVSYLEYIEDALEDENEKDLAKDIGTLADSVEDSVDAVLAGSLSVLDIQTICALPGDVLNLVADASIALGMDEDDVEDEIEELYEDNFALSFAKNVSIGILIFVGLMVLAALFNVVSILLNRRGLMWILIVLWSLLVLIMLFPVILFVSNEGYFTLQIGPILGLAFAIAACVVWEKEYYALKVAGHAMNQPFNHIVEVAKPVVSQAATQVTTVKEKIVTQNPAPAATATTFCGTCGAPATNSSAAFCSNCGTPVAPVVQKTFCGNCGAEQKAGSKFCGNCGTKSDA